MPRSAVTSHDNKILKCTHRNKFFAPKWSLCLLNQFTKAQYVYQEIEMEREYRCSWILISYIILGLLFPVTGMTSSRVMRLSDLYANALSEEFNSCMERVEKDNLKYQECRGFSSYLDCRCNFLKEVEHQCVSSGERYVNHWYLQRHKRDSCKMDHKVPGWFSEQEREGNDPLHHNVAVSGTHGEAQKQECEQVQNSNHKAYEANELTNRTADHNLNDIVDKLYTSSTVFNILGFRDHYEKNSPNAMTIDCQFMRSLKVTASPVENRMTTFSTTILFQNPTGTHTSSIEAIKVLPKDTVRPI